MSREDLFLMTWATVFDYMLRVAPDLRDAVVGVPEEHLSACEQNWALELPDAYRGFLATMGVDAGRFSPLGGKEWNFYELLRDPPEDYEPQRFFRIGVDVDDSLITWTELYLDMGTRRADGDCELIEVEWLESPSTATPPSSRETFLERLVCAAWIGLDGCRFSYDRFILAEGPALDSIHQVLTRVGFSPALAFDTRESVWWLKPDGSGASASCSGGARSSVIIAGDDEALVRRVTQLLLDNVPGAAVSRSSPSFFKGR